MAPTGILATLCDVQRGRLGLPGGAPRHDPLDGTQEVPDDLPGQDGKGEIGERHGAVPGEVGLQFVGLVDAEHLQQLEALRLHAVERAVQAAGQEFRNWGMEGQIFNSVFSNDLLEAILFQYRCFYPLLHLCTHY